MEKLPASPQEVELHKIATVAEYAIKWMNFHIEVCHNHINTLSWSGTHFGEDTNYFHLICDGCGSTLILKTLDGEMQVTP